MKPSYGRLTRWVLRTSPEHAQLLIGGNEDLSNNAVLYRLSEELTGFKGLELTTPNGVEVYIARNLGKVEKREILLVTKPEDNSDAYLCLTCFEFINTKTPKLGVITEFPFLDPNYSSKAFADLISNQKSKHKALFPSKELYVRGLERRLGFEHVVSPDSSGKIIGYRRISD